VTWENTKRVKAKARRRRDLHESRIAAAPTQKQKLSAACQWLISEAWRADSINDAVAYVLAYVHELREEESKK
jgi:hypothetical protein